MDISFGIHMASLSLQIEISPNFTYSILLFFVSSPGFFQLSAPRNVHSALHRYASRVDKCHSSVYPFEGP